VFGTTSSVLGTTSALFGTTSAVFGTTGGNHSSIPPPFLFKFQPTIATYFGYTPDVGLAVSATVLFSIASLALSILCIVFRRRKVLYFLVLPLIAGVVECLGYGLRAKMAIDGTLPLIWQYIVSLVALIIAPIFVALGNYLVCGSIVRYVGVQYSLFRPAIIERFFVISDVASFLVQGIGASVFASATTNNSPQSVFDTAQAILIAGFVIQLAALALFLVTCVYVDIRTRSHPSAAVCSGPWRRMFVALYVSVSAILVRSIYRTIEFEAGRGTALATEINGKEAYFGVFEALMVFIAFAIYVPFHPGFFDISVPVVNQEASTPPVVQKRSSRVAPMDVLEAV